ncbi:MAG: hypothetical protein BM557_08260 [Flavobacterium sp. MedPE-SWcel]|uniref:DUF3078 domain-containing protein n=1 Tax=uncultured Flavobacterium sp. TaxID=165435 RepID=UPI00091497B7|nr:DUF3078 domain-containing protein [uncultured Flavobacterium sp.]OIQ17672.1 MAG: hypothetical protein BM557_08260 [Flavobacterium sp. MedPE-SWcel]
MKFKISFSVLLILLFIQNIQSQNIDTTVKDTVDYWTRTNKVGLDISEIAFINWSVGGNNSITVLGKGDFNRNYHKENLNWDNELLLRYGFNSQEGQEIRKTDDQIKFTSTFGYRTDTISHWYYSAKFNLNTQFRNGYAYPNTTDEISGPFSPAYVFLGIGSEYIRKDLGLNAYFSPLTNKTTLVLNHTLADQGAFGVDPAVYDEEGNLVRRGKTSRTEMGILVTNNIKRKIFKNIILDHRISLYTDYINNFGNIDLDWQLQLDMTVNEYVKANIGLHIIYDDDIKATEEVDGETVQVGPKLQLKQMLGLGVTYSF